MPSPLICIPPDDVFRYDRLNLEPAIAGRTQALLSHSPQAVAIDGRWGTGKSTFLALWAAYLRGEGVKVVQFNVWKSFGADPFNALTREILLQVDIPRSKQTTSHKRLLAFLGRHASLLAQGARIASSLQPELEAVSQATAIGLESAGSIAKSESSDISDFKVESPDAFASLLSSAAMEWSARPVVVMIDELDRCSPEYSVEMLQLLEHVFHAEGVVFVVAVNQSELIHSIRSFYGQGFDAGGYLERFFDDVLPLPASNRPQYIESSLSPVASQDTSSVLPFLEASELSLREIDKSIQNLRDVLDSQPRPAYALVELWIARTLAPMEYRQFILGEISDKVLADAIFARGACRNLRSEGRQHENYVAQRMESTLIASSCVLPRGSVPSYRSGPATESELYRHHQDIVEDARVDGDVSVSYSQGVLEMAASSSQSLASRRGDHGIGMAARLLDRESPLQ